MIIGAGNAEHERAPVRPCRAVARRDPEGEGRRSARPARGWQHDAAASDRLRAEATDPSKTRKPTSPKLKPVPEAAVSVVGDTLREQGMAAPVTGGGTIFLQAKTAHEVLKAQERRIRLAKLKGELVDRDRAAALGPARARGTRRVGALAGAGGCADGGGVDGLMQRSGRPRGDH